MSARPVRSSPLAAIGALIALLAIATLARSRETPPSPAAARPVPAGPIDLNHASAQELERLPRIGPTLAARIVEHRERHGPFSSLAELDDVQGVGPAVLRALDGHAIVTEASGADAGVALPAVPDPR